MHEGSSVRKGRQTSPDKRQVRNHRTLRGEGRQTVHGGRRRQWGTNLPPVRPSKTLIRHPGVRWRMGSAWERDATALIPALQEKILRLTWWKSQTYSSTKSKSKIHPPTAFIPCNSSKYRWAGRPRNKHRRPRYIEPQPPNSYAFAIHSLSAGRRRLLRSHRCEATRATATATSAKAIEYYRQRPKCFHS